MSRTGALGALLASTVGCVLVVVVALLAPDPAPARRPPPATADDRSAPLEVLKAWDAARVQAWVDGDASALAALYTGTSRAGLADRRLLAAYDARGLRVRGLDVQRAAVEVVHEAEDRVVLLVTDRLVDGWVRTAAGERVDLPRDRWSTRRVVLAGRDGEWRVAGVRDRAGRAPTRAPR